MPVLEIENGHIVVKDYGPVGNEHSDIAQERKINENFISIYKAKGELLSTLDHYINMNEAASVRYGFYYIDRRIALVTLSDEIVNYPGFDLTGRNKRYP